jgi:outer membrane protein assembly factor BamB
LIWKQFVSLGDNFSDRRETVATPVTDGERVYGLTNTRKILFLQAADGEVLWIRNRAEGVLGKIPFGGGCGSSPMI